MGTVSSLISRQTSDFGDAMSNFYLDCRHKQGKIQQKNQASNSIEITSQKLAKPALKQDHTKSLTYDQLSADEKRRRFKEELNCSWCAENIKEDRDSDKAIAWLERRRSSCCDRCTKGHRRSSSDARTFITDGRYDQLPTLKVIQASVDVVEAQFEAASTVAVAEASAHVVGNDALELAASPSNNSPKPEETTRENKCGGSNNKKGSAYESSEVSPFSTVNETGCDSDAERRENSMDSSGSSVCTYKEELAVSDDSENENAKVSDCVGTQKATTIKTKSMLSENSEYDAKQESPRGYKTVIDSLSTYQFGSSLEIDKTDYLHEERLPPTKQFIEKNQLDSIDDFDEEDETSLEVNYKNNNRYRTASICTICEEFSDAEFAEIGKSFDEDQKTLPSFNPKACKMILNDKASLQTDELSNCLDMFRNGNLPSLMMKQENSNQCANAELCGRLCEMFNHGINNEFDTLDTEVMRLMDTLDKLSSILAEKEKVISKKSKLDQLREKAEQLEKWKQLGISIRKVKNGKRLIILKVGLNRYHIEGKQEEHHCKTHTYNTAVSISNLVCTQAT